MSSAYVHQGKFRIGWRLFKSSWRVASYGKRLMLFSAFGYVASIVVVAAIAMMALILIRSLGIVISFNVLSIGIYQAIFLILIIYIALILVMLAVPAINVYFRAAQIAGMHKRLSGGYPTLFGSLRDIGHVQFKIIRWGGSYKMNSIFSRRSLRGRAKQGMLATIQKSKSFVQRSLMVSLFISEGPSLENAKERSEQLTRDSWEEQFEGNAALSSIFTLFALLVMAAFAAFGIATFSVKNITPLLLGAAVAIFCIICFSVWWSLITSAFRAATYIYVATGKVPEAFVDAEFFTFLQPTDEAGESSLPNPVNPSNPANPSAPNPNPDSANHANPRNPDPADPPAIN